MKAIPFSLRSETPNADNMGFHEISPGEGFISLLQAIHER